MAAKNDVVCEHKTEDHKTASGSRGVTIPWCR